MHNRICNTNYVLFNKCVYSRIDSIKFAVKLICVAISGFSMK